MPSKHLSFKLISKLFSLYVHLLEMCDAAKRCTSDKTKENKSTLCYAAIIMHPTELGSLLLKSN